MSTISINKLEYSNDENGLAVVHIFGRNEIGEAKRLDVTDFLPYFYVASDSTALDEELPEGVDIDPTEFISIKKEPCTKLWVKNPSDIKKVRDAFVHYEADIGFTNRFQIDTKLKSGVSYPDGSDTCDYKQLTPVDVDYPIRKCIVDIECFDGNNFPQANRDPITCITCHDSFDDAYVSFVLVNSVPVAERELATVTPQANGCFNPAKHTVCLFANEFDLLTSFAQYIDYTNPDVLTGWNFAEFDMPYILGRFTVNNIPKDSIARLPGGAEDKPTLKGRQIFDLLLGYKRMHLTQKESYRLDAIAFEELGKNKIHFNGKICSLPISKLIEYNFVDVELCVGLDRKDEIVQFHVEIAKYVGCSLDRTLNSMPIIDTYILQKAHGRYVLPSIANIQRGADFEGATVLTPKKGLHKNVIVLDLTSLYPMIMMTGNMSPDTKDPEGEIVTPIGVRFRKNPDGLVREIQSEFFKERKEMKAKRNTFAFVSRDYKLMDMKQNVIKVLMNSYYGVSGNERFRLYDRDIGASITAVGRKILEHGKQIIEKQGYEVILGDTDSVLFISKVDTKEEAIPIARSLEKMLNDSYPAFAKECLNSDTSYFSVKFEKFYSRFFSGGKKKRYAGLLSWKEGKDVNEIDIVGFETKRSDSPAVTKLAQKYLVESVLNGVEYEEIRTHIQNILKKYMKKGFTLDEMGIPGGIGKELSAYETKDAQARGAEYANKYFGAHFGQGSKPKRIYIKAVPFGFEKTDVLCFEYGESVPKNFIINYDVMMEKTLQRPLERIMDALGWDWNSFDPRLTTLSQWGFD